MKNIYSDNQNNKYFHTDHLKADLKGHSVRGGVITMVAQVLKFVFSLGSNVILARLLTPQDYGLVGMVTVVIGFVSIFKDLGLSMATIQKEKINHEQVSTLFWLNVALSIIIALLTVAIAPGIAWFYQEPRLIWITVALAFGFVISGLGVQHSALLNRQMQYKVLMLNDIVSMLAGIIAGITAVFYGAGYWTLVILPIVTAAFSTTGYWVVCSWRPGLPRVKSGVASMLAFGGNLTGFTIVNYFARNLDNVLIGRYWGTQQLGLYAKAYQLLFLPLSQINTPISNVVIPTLSRLQEEPKKFRQYYLEALSIVVFMTMPIITFMVVASEEIIELLLGTQWRDATILFRVLSISALVQPVCNTAGWLYISTGRTDRMLKWGFIASTAILTSFCIGLPYGAIGISFCYCIGVILVTWPCMAYATNKTSILTIDILLTVQKPLIASLISVIPCWFLKLWLKNSISPLGMLITNLLLFTIFYYLTMVYVFKIKKEYLPLLKSIFKFN